MTATRGHWVRRHALSIAFLFGALGVAGVISARYMPVSLFPRTTFPRVVVSLEAGDRPADRMEVEVTVPVEEAVRAVPGVRRIRSATSRGSAEVSLNFAWGTDMIAATLQVESALSQIRTSLPDGTTFLVRRMDPTVFPVLAFSLTSDVLDPVALRDLAIYQVRPLLSTVPGVARVGVLGGETREVQVIVDPIRLDAFGITLADVARTLGASNDVRAVGRIEDLDHLYLVLGDTRFQSAEEITNTVIKSASGGLIRLEDVAVVHAGVEPRWTRVRADGHAAVLFQVYQQPDGDTLAIARRVRTQMERLRSRLPRGVRVANWYDQSELIRAAAGSVRDTLIIGIVLAFLVLWLFLRRLRVSLVAVVSVPLSLAITALILRLLGQSFNLMTLGGMAAAVGLIVDDALVMVEHIERRVPHLEGPLSARVAAAAREFTVPLVGSSAVSIIVFAPMGFMSGVTGAFFRPLALTIAVSLTISLLVAWIVVPLAVERTRAISDRVKRSAPTRSGALAAGYRALLGPLLRHPWLGALILVPFLVAGWLGYQRTGSGFMPAMDEGGFVLDYVVPAGTSLTETDRVVRQIEDILRQTPEVQTYSRRTGVALGGGLTEANEGDFFVRLRPFPRRGIQAVMDEVRAKIRARVPGVDVEMALLMEDLIGDLTAVPQPIEIKVFSDDAALLGLVAPAVAKAIGKLRGVVDVRSGIVLAGDAIDVRVDRDAAALEGMTPAEVTAQVSSWVSGVVTTSLLQGPKMVGVRVWTSRRHRASRRELSRVRIRAPDGHVLPLSRVAHLSVSEGQAQIAREDLKRMVAITGRISGRDMGSTLRDVRRVLDRQGLIPQGAYYRLGGLYEEQQQAMRSLALVLGAALALVFAVLLMLYERFWVAVCSLVPALGAAAFSFAGLWVTGIDLNITAMMGITMAVGIVTEVSIFYIHGVVTSQAKDLPGRLVEAGLKRARPIVMTALVATLALLPITFGLGEGAAILRPMAVAIIAGLIAEIPLTLVLLPILLRLARMKPEAGS